MDSLSWGFFLEMALSADKLARSTNRCFVLMTARPEIRTNSPAEYIAFHQEHHVPRFTLLPYV